MFGLLDDPQADAATAKGYGISPEQLSQQRMGSLGQMGALLLAAAQPGQVGDRAKVLAKMADVSGDAQKGLLGMQQATQNATKIRNDQEAEKRRQALVAMIASDTTLNPQQRAAALANPEGFATFRSQQEMQRASQLQSHKDIAAYELSQQPEKDKLAIARQTQIATAEAEAKRKAQFNALSDGVTDPKQLEIARGIAGGRYVKGEHGELIDMMTGMPVVQRQQLQINSGTGQSPQAGDLPVMPRDVTYSAATGPAANFKHVFNLATNGWADPDQMRGENALNQLRTSTSIELGLTMPGRDNAAMQKKFDELSVKPGDWTSYDGRDKDKLQEVHARLDGEIKRLTETYNSSRPEITAADRSKIVQAIPRLQHLRDQYKTVIDNFDGPQKGAAPTPPKRVVGEVDDFSRVPEGKRYEDTKTGKIMIKRNGVGVEWKPGSN